MDERSPRLSRSPRRWPGRRPPRWWGSKGGEGEVVDRERVGQAVTSMVAALRRRLDALGKRAKGAA